MDDHIPVADFHIQASSNAAAIPKLVLKHEESFLVCDRRGDFPAYFDGELGFYHEGTRYLRWLELRLNGDRPLLLNAEVATDNDQIMVGLTNADIQVSGGFVPRNTIYLDRLLLLYQPHLLASLTLSSFHDAPCEVTIEWIFAADFRDVFEVRGTTRARRGEVLPAETGRDSVSLRYRGLDDVVRTTRVTFDPAPLVLTPTRALYRLVLAPNETRRLELTATASSADAEVPRPSVAGALRQLRGPEGARRSQTARVQTDNDAFNALVCRSLGDLDVLMTDTVHGRIPYAGVPWYVAPFGRDSIITAYQLLPFDASVAAGTLRFLAAWQGRTVDAFRDEEPGKILHEYRRGEMANCREIPFIPYYGTIDATPLFVMLLAAYVRWTADLALLRELWPSARAALHWMRTYGDRDGDGFLEYATHSSLGLGNQGWKDSADAVSHADGTLAQAPIALVEVQGYAYAALRDAAELARLVGDAGQDVELRRAADALRLRFNRDFWLEDEGFYALALDADKRPCEVIASNAGHALWTGVVEEARASIVAKRLLADDMFTGWGIRTLSSRERRYNPLSYHNGSVWPHDNGLIAAGFARYGFTHAVQTIMSGHFDASRFFEHARIPELFCGFARQAAYGPIAYPVACAPQAWAAGCVLQLLTAACGLEVDALANCLTLRNPVLPPWLRLVEIHGLRVGSSSVDIALSGGRESAAVELLGRRGDVEVVVRR
jgi:glycogen debranching enzyme